VHSRIVESCKLTGLGKESGEMQSPNENLRETADDCESDNQDPPRRTQTFIWTDSMYLASAESGTHPDSATRICSLVVHLLDTRGVACILGMISEKDPAAWIAISLLLLRDGCLYVGGRGLVVALTAPHKARGAAR
jgi:hypothetical protein